MKFSKGQKTVLVIEIIALLSGGGVLAFVPEKPRRAPRVVTQEIKHDITGMAGTPVEMLSADERARLEDVLKIDLNTASADEMQNIPRVGPSMAAAIVAYREQHGPFRSFADLDAIPRMGPSMLAVLPKYARLSGVDSAMPVQASEGDKIDINTASLEELQKIPGVGPSMAEKIIAARPFRSVEDLDNVPGVGPAKLDNIRPHVRCGVMPGVAPARPGATSTPVAGAKVNINTATQEQLETLPGVGPSMATAIIAHRTQNGRFNTVDELDNVPRIGPAALERLRPLVTVQ